MGILYRETDANAASPAEYTQSTASLTVGTHALTPMGRKPVEELTVEDSLITKDYGVQSLSHIRFFDIDLNIEPDAAPVQIDHPRHSGPVAPFFAPDQYIALKHPMFHVFFNMSEILVRCRDLIGMPGVHQTTDLSSVTYVGLGMHRHHLIYCDDVLVDIGPTAGPLARMSVGAEEARLAWRLIRPTAPPPKRHSLPFH